MKETFIIRTEWAASILELDPTDQATILRNLFAYHSGEDVTLDTFGVRIVWKLIEPTLTRNMDTYDRKVQTNRENGKLGGRPATKTKEETQINPNNPTVILPISQTKDETLSDYDSEYDNDYESDSESGSVSIQNPPTPENNKNYPDLALPAPGPENTHDAQFYEIEICKNLRIPPDKLIFIWNKWMNSRKDRLFTRREARNDFRSYASSIAMDSNSMTTLKSSSPIKNIEYAPSG